MHPHSFRGQSHASRKPPSPASQSAAAKGPHGANASERALPPTHPAGGGRPTAGGNLRSRSVALFPPFAQTHRPLEAFWLDHTRGTRRHNHRGLFGYLLTVVGGRPPRRRPAGCWLSRRRLDPPKNSFVCGHGGRSSLVFLLRMPSAPSRSLLGIDSSHLAGLRGGWLQCSSHKRRGWTRPHLTRFDGRRLPVLQTPGSHTL